MKTARHEATEAQSKIGANLSRNACHEVDAVGLILSILHDPKYLLLILMAFT